MIQVTNHAVQRYQECVAQISARAIRTIIRGHAQTIELAVGFGCDAVICGDGTRLKLKGRVVATVIGKR